ncbi:hypothetical protein G9A89_001407 [Geosiphon pyriformis]|nr:hypothetical protein G9A89_001407 [Geosiphon pyriformis]
MNGFLCSLESIDMKANVATFFENINLSLGVEVSDMVFSTLAELQAITLAFECVPSLNSVYLFSDSQAALDVCKSELLNLNVGWHKVKEHLSILDNNQADLLTGISSYSGQLLLLQLKEYFVLANGSIVSENSRHFVYDIFWSIYRVCWELSSGAKIVDSCLLTDIDWFRLSLVWHPDFYMAAGFMSCYSAGFHSYFMKALHYRLSIAVRKCLYNKHYLSVMCLYCGNIEVSDHVFFCAFDVAVQS